MRLSAICSLLATLLEASRAQWDSVCGASVGEGAGAAAWNQTRCDSAVSSCCASGFSVSGWGCCPYVNATCCPNGYACCPAASQCVLRSGSGYDTIYDCVPQGKDGAAAVVADDAGNTTSASVCKPGPELPMSDKLQNVVWIGDSLSIGACCLPCWFASHSFPASPSAPCTLLDRHGACVGRTAQGPGSGPTLSLGCL